MAELVGTKFQHKQTILIFQSKFYQLRKQKAKRLP